MIDDDSTDLDHARNTGANWGREAALELLRALEHEDAKPIVQRMQAALDELRAKIDAAHGTAIGQEWHVAAMSAVEAALPKPSDVKTAA